MSRKRNDALVGRLAVLVASGHTVTGAAKALSVIPRTAQNWARQPAFKAAVSRHQKRISDSTLARLIRHSAKAVNVIAKLMTTGENGTVKLSAARTMLDKMIEVRNHAQTAEQVAELAARIASLEGNHDSR
jgi:uncharacterized protein (UPF0147 family)